MPFSSTLLHQRITQPYHQNHSLLFQFILSELFLAHAEIEHLNATSSEISSPCSWRLIEPLVNSLAKLVGSTQGYMRLFSWNDFGILTKIKNYSALLSQSLNKEEVAMHREANQAWLLSLQALDIIYANRHVEIINVQPLLNALSKLQSCMQRFARLVSKIIIRFKDDENVIFFILRHIDPMNALYGTGFVHKIFGQMFGKKIEAVKDFLEQRYTNRGFLHLLPIIHEKFAELTKP